jgi:hypothetical protein
MISKRWKNQEESIQERIVRNVKVFLSYDRPETLGKIENISPREGKT